ncbi:hypothetical protein TEA_022274 [Camellia sinensis var. sinensis]|uniref:DUF7755 domain-containing protein n=1 Tax=Camellia sinensis var. sinensis TaxID=542762 RepID=A0A4S4EQQ0_CAMSN|nr:hypothetical protein TEA_022274 [Camellia sinensis var. sinensis]
MSGQWRLGDVSLIVTFLYQPTSRENGGKEIQYIGFEYRFEVEDTFLCEGSDISIPKLRPCLVREFSWDNLTLLSEYLLQPTSIVSDSGITNEESMREYADLKYSLLLNDSLLVLVGSSIAFFSVGKNAAFAFLDSGGMVLTPKEVMFGMLGFLGCKVVVVLAAFKTMPMGLKENE